MGGWLVVGLVGAGWLCLLAVALALLTAASRADDEAGAACLAVSQGRQALGERRVLPQTEGQADSSHPPRPRPQPVFEART